MVFGNGTSLHNTLVGTKICSLCSIHLKDGSNRYPGCFVHKGGYVCTQCTEIVVSSDNETCDFCQSFGFCKYCDLETEENSKVCNQCSIKEKKGKPQCKDCKLRLVDVGGNYCNYCMVEYPFECENCSTPIREGKKCHSCDWKTKFGFRNCLDCRKRLTKGKTCEFCLQDNPLKYTKNTCLKCKKKIRGDWVLCCGCQPQIFENKKLMIMGT